LADIISRRRCSPPPQQDLDGRRGFAERPQDGAREWRKRCVPGYLGESAASTGHLGFRSSLVHVRHRLRLGNVDASMTVRAVRFHSAYRGGDDIAPTPPGPSDHGAGPAGRNVAHSVHGPSLLM
jgi:hypothetical protein